MADSVVLSADLKSGETRVQPELLGLPLTPQALIDALTNIDLVYEREAKELSNNRMGATLKYHLLEKSREQHRQKREPYALQLIALQDELKMRRT